tara:strand:+ start:1295 stop:2014 length:720 start_codon:yes stop_codon:yes gene_type:complete
MESSELDGVIPVEIDELDMLKHRLDSEFQRTIFRIISLILTWLIGIFSIYMLIDVEPLVNQVGIPSSILFVLLFPILLIIAWGAADHQRRVDLDQSIRVEHDDERESNVDQIINNTSNDPLAKEVSSTGGAIYKTRGKDPKGVAFGGGADTFDSNMPTIDGMELKIEHEGLEGELERSTLIKVEADDIAAELSQTSWERSEKNDPELIEAGVERLGDLVGQGHFGGPVPSNSEEYSESP